MRARSAVSSNSNNIRPDLPCHITLPPVGVSHRNYSICERHTALPPATTEDLPCHTSHIWMTHSDMYHDSFLHVPWLVLTCEWLIQTCTMTHSHMCHDRSYMWMTHSDMYHDSFLNVPWLIRTCATTHAYVRHDSFTACAHTYPHVWIPRVTRHTYGWVMAHVTHMNESCYTAHVWLSHVTCHTYGWVMLHVTRMNESWHMSRTWMSHVTHHTYEWVMAHMNESWHMSHIWMGRDTHAIVDSSRASFHEHVHVSHHTYE